MAEKTLNAYVVLGGKVDNSFGQIGQSLINVGQTVDDVSEKLINFGKESIKTYRDYEDSMLDAQVALSTTYGRGSKALNDVMRQLDTAASEWAATTIFHTDDVANAISEAAHANWDLDKILEGMPAAMRLAQAGSLDLSTGLDYIIKTTNAAGISFGDLNDWIDEWTFAANSSAGTVDEFGQAMLKMGSTMKFADNKEELLTMIAVLHDAGTTGSSAGTLLRNSMIRLVAPTKNATEAMKSLGIAQSDIDEAMEDTGENYDQVMKKLKGLGFSAYDSKGNLKDITTIFEDLYTATKGMTDDERYDVWSAIFPTRTITGAMALMDAAGNNWNGLLDALTGGDASGYGEYAAETMMSGLTGSIETFNSKIEDLKKTVGDQLAPQLETVAANLGKVIDLIRAGGQDNGVSSGLDWITGVSEAIGSLADGLQGMDPAVFDALSGALGAIATLGPALTISGLALRGIGNVVSMFTGSTLGKIILIASAVSVVATAMKAYNEAKFLENFGDMRIDTTTLDAQMTAIADAFQKGNEQVNAFANALDDSVKNYNTASQTFSATMMEDLLSNQTLTGEAREKKLAEYRTLGSDMVKYLQDGITASTDMSAEFWDKVFNQTDINQALENNEAYAGLIKALDDEKTEAMAEATAIGEELQKAITAAWEDGNLDEGEREKIKEYFRQLNEAMAEAEREAQNEADFVRRRQMMDKAQGMNYSQMREYIQNTVLAQRQEELNWYQDHYNGELYRLQYRRDKMLAEGDVKGAANIDRLINGWDDEGGHHAGAAEAVKNAQAGVYSDYDQLIMSWYAATLADSDMRGGIPALQQAAAWLTGGQETNQHVLLDYLRSNYGGNYMELQEYYQEELQALGNVEEIKDRISRYRESGDATLMDMADQLQSLLAIYSILNPDSRIYEEYENYRPLATTDLMALYQGGAFSQEGMNYLKALRDPDYDSGYFQEYHDRLDATTQGYIDAMAEAFGKEYDIDRIIAERISDSELYPGLRDDYALAALLGMSESERAQYALNPEISMEEQAAEEAKKARTGIEQEFATPILGTVQLRLDGSGLLGGFIKLPGMASGGRTDKPVIFGEAGPEWFIPEEHSLNTAGLLLAAAEKSGFSMAELAAMSGMRMFADGGTTGELNWGSLPGSGGDSGGDINVQYSPVINGDGDGLERILREDKERIEKWFAEFMEKRTMYQSMVAYA